MLRPSSEDVQSFQVVPLSRKLRPVEETGVYEEAADAVQHLT